MLRYRCEGDGEPLLLIHGWGITYQIWENLIPILRPFFRLIMIELPGVGNSPLIDGDQPYYVSCADAIEEVRTALGVTKWSILAYSSGTRAAEAYIQRYPDSIHCSIFLCPVYLNEICSLAVRLLDTTHPPRILTNWLLSDWRLYGLILALAFNGRPHYYTHTWKDEIELQSIDILKRMLCELPGRGRAPFTLPQVPTLFIWGSYDPLVSRPRHPHPNDVIIPANHSAPMLAAPKVASLVIPFIKDGIIVQAQNKRKLWLYQKRKESAQAGKRARLRSIISKAGVTRFLPQKSKEKLTVIGKKRGRKLS